MTKKRQLQLWAWGLALLVSGLAFAQWVAHLPSHHPTLYDIFPLFGLLAFGLMWTHYIIGSIERYFQAPKGTFKHYFTLTAGLVLGLIILHPLLLWWQLWVDGFGLPPASSLSLYVDMSGRTALIFGTLSLMIFLAFEFRRQFSARSWWKYIEYLNVAAMFAIFIHALILGGEIRGWFRALWIIYGLILVASIAYNGIHDRRKV